MTFIFQVSLIKGRKKPCRQDLSDGLVNSWMMCVEMNTDKNTLLRCAHVVVIDNNSAHRL